jgi:hypothetical protein
VPFAYRDKKVVGVFVRFLCATSTVGIPIHTSSIYVCIHVDFYISGASALTLATPGIT